MTVAVSALMLSASAKADLTVDFSYTGNSGPPHNFNESGTGSFSFSSALTTVDQSDLSSFSFQTTWQGQTYTYTLTDLTTFTATLGSGPTVETLSLTTDVVGTPIHGLETFTISSLATGGAFTQEAAGGDRFPNSTGTVTITSIGAAPEPSTAIVAAFGAVAFLTYGWSRRRGNRGCWPWSSWPSSKATTVGSGGLI
jgi:hypothetical protein